MAQAAASDMFVSFHLKYRGGEKKNCFIYFPWLRCMQCCAEEGGDSGALKAAGLHRVSHCIRGVTSSIRTRIHKDFLTSRDVRRHKIILAKLENEKKALFFRSETTLTAFYSLLFPKKWHIWSRFSEALLENESWFVYLHRCTTELALMLLICRNLISKSELYPALELPASQNDGVLFVSHCCGIRARQFTMQRCQKGKNPGHLLSSLFHSVCHQNESVSCQFPLNEWGKCVDRDITPTHQESLPWGS